MNSGSNLETLEAHLGVGRPYFVVSSHAISHLLYLFLKLSELVLNEAS